MFRIIGFISLMLNRFIYILLLLSFLLPYDNKWAKTRFEHWWNEKFNSMLYREHFSFIPISGMNSLYIFRLQREKKLH